MAANLRSSFVVLFLLRGVAFPFPLAPTVPYFSFLLSVQYVPKSRGSFLFSLCGGTGSIGSRGRHELVGWREVSLAVASVRLLALRLRLFVFFIVGIVALAFALSLLRLLATLADS